MLVKMRFKDGQLPVLFRLLPFRYKMRAINEDFSSVSFLVIVKNRIKLGSGCSVKFCLLSTFEQNHIAFHVVLL